MIYIYIYIYTHKYITYHSENKQQSPNLRMPVESYKKQSWLICVYNITHATLQILRVVTKNKKNSVTDVNQCKEF